MFQEQDLDLQMQLEFHPELILKSIPKPFFLTTLFPEVPKAICRPLFAPFSHFAITHYGEIFCRKPLMRMHLGDEFTIVDPTMVLTTGGTQDGRTTVSLQNNLLGIKKTYHVDRLVLHLFYGVDIHDKLYSVEHVDGNNANNHFNNLVANYVDPIALESCLSDTEEDHNDPLVWEGEQDLLAFFHRCK